MWRFIGAESVFAANITFFLHISTGRLIDEDVITTTDTPLGSSTTLPRESSDQPLEVIMTASNNTDPSSQLLDASDLSSSLPQEVHEQSSSPLPEAPEQSSSSISEAPKQSSSPLPEAPESSSSPTPEVPEQSSSPTLEAPEQSSSTLLEAHDLSSSPPSEISEQSSSPPPDVPQRSSSPTPEVPERSSSPTPETPEQSSSSPPEVPEQSSSPTLEAPEQSSSTLLEAHDLSSSPPSEISEQSSSPPPDVPQRSSPTPEVPERSASPTPETPEQSSSSPPEVPEQSSSPTLEAPEQSSSTLLEVSDLSSSSPSEISEQSSSPPLDVPERSSSPTPEAPEQPSSPLPEVTEQSSTPSRVTGTLSSEDIELSTFREHTSIIPSLEITISDVVEISSSRQNQELASSSSSPIQQHESTSLQESTELSTISEQRVSLSPSEQSSVRYSSSARNEGTSSFEIEPYSLSNSDAADVSSLERSTSVANPIREMSSYESIFSTSDTVLLEGTVSVSSFIVSTMSPELDDMDSSAKPSPSMQVDDTTVLSSEGSSSSKGIDTQNSIESTPIETQTTSLAPLDPSSNAEHLNISHHTSTMMSIPDTSSIAISASISPTGTSVVMSSSEIGENPFSKKQFHIFILLLFFKVVIKNNNYPTFTKSNNSKNFM